MKMIFKIYLTALVVSLLPLSSSYAQMVKGYFPYYRSVAQANAVNYSQLTDVIYAFASIDANGNLAIMTPATFNAVKTQCDANGVRLWVAIGGWGLSGNFPGVAGNAGRRTTLANACLNLCTTYGLAGIDIDWEFPAAGDAANYTAMLAAIKGALGTTYKLSAALGGESFSYGCINQGHAVGVQAAAFTHLDYFNIMSYDAPSCYGHHTSVDFMQRSMDGWYAKGCPYEKMVPGIAFYSRCAGEQTYSTISASDASGYFNDADGDRGGYCYDSKPTIQAKVNYAMCTKGAPGVMVWELSQDRSDAYALLPVMKDAVDACACPFSDPDLGPDVSLCGVASVILNSGIATNSPSRTFTWKRNGTNVVTNSTTATTYNATSAGTYEVSITEGSCTKTDQIIVSANLPTPALGSDFTICNPASATLSPTNLASFPGGTTWQWSYAGSPVTGETNSSLTNVRRAGLYRLTASISGCGSTFDEITLASSLPTPVDGCKATSGTVNLSITNPGLGAGPYNWYAASSGGSSLATGTSYSPSVSSTTTFYVQDGATGASGNVGKPDNSGGWNAGDYTQKIVFDVLQALTINSVVVYPASSQNVTIRVLESDGVTVVDQQTFIGVGTGAQTLNVNFSVPVGTGYLMDAVGTTGQLSYGGAFTFPSTIPGVLSVTGQAPSWTEGDRYNYIFNWNVSSGSPCARLPVIATIGAGCGSLPVEFEDIYASKTETGTKVSWRTSRELNNDYFEVEKSLDGRNFVSIGMIEGAGTTTSQNLYSFTDSERSGGMLYYRIVQVDMDGSKSYSEVVSIESENAVTISPNPFSDHTLIRLSGSSLSVLVKVYDLAGNNILSEERLLENGTLKIGEQLPEGAYILQLISNDNVQTHRIIKVK